MHCDGALHEKGNHHYSSDSTINGLNPNATNVLEKMKKAPTTTIEAISELL
jgi:hypothetical protein